MTKKQISAEEVRIGTIACDVFNIQIPKDVHYMKDGEFAEYIGEQLKKEEK